MDEELLTQNELHLIWTGKIYLWLKDSKRNQECFKVNPLKIKEEKLEVNILKSFALEKNGNVDIIVPIKQLKETSERGCSNPLFSY